jgi:hypothetical protein
LNERVNIYNNHVLHLQYIAKNYNDKYQKVWEKLFVQEAE